MTTSTNTETVSIHAQLMYDLRDRADSTKWPRSRALQQMRSTRKGSIAYREAYGEYQRLCGEMRAAIFALQQVHDALVEMGLEPPFQVIGKIPPPSSKFRV